MLSNKLSAELILLIFLKLAQLLNDVEIKFCIDPGKLLFLSSSI
jgi:hypothetical protein